jgi:mannose-1-phosphate guanylyltransferase
MLLAAGLGTRLRPITYEMPKPMVPVLNRPVMEHIVRLLARHGFTETIANLHWFPDLITGHFGDGSRFGVELTYSREERLLGTSGGVRNAAGFLGDSFLVISGDALTDVDLTAMREFHESHDGIATLATKRVEDTTQFGVAISGADGRIQGFQEKPEPAEALSDLANCGIYMFRSEIFDFFPPPGTSEAAEEGDPDEFADWALDVFPRALEADVPFYSHEIEAYWNDIGNLEELRTGNLDALHGKVEVEREGEWFDGYRSGVPQGDEGTLRGPVLIGPGCEIGEDVRIDGPAVIGDGAQVGDGARLRDVIALPGAEIPAGAVLIGAIAGRRIGVPSPRHKG